MHILSFAKILKASLTVTFMVLVSFAVILPASANSIVLADTQSQMMTGHDCDQPSQGVKHIKSADCCDPGADQSCPDHMNCANDCVSSCVGAVTFLSPANMDILPSKIDVPLPQNTRSQVFAITMDAPPPRS